ncbi:hypothetical protein DFW101_3575 [Solidesulfovibrio carbinoliphilus subsp. oakridgensis]|uniref:Uncharacterized protein n=1 Tax=Solidesulfovibrio carbinoliphilus subsp. oakridgensis TaxID=694327 RepID=G7Q5L2_9BACT|nr:hypothetical protein [Solidesulfovibrio carbinoliphilus]EHJ49571.1 hypothetical protein DFW101_3575 [Solidesulfovibrio carbinoliphilus subsp. oakridgensis]
MAKIEEIRARLAAAHDTGQGFKNLCMSKDSVGYHAEEDLAYLLARVEKLERVAEAGRRLITQDALRSRAGGAVLVGSGDFNGLDGALAALDADEKGEAAHAR